MKAHCRSRVTLFGDDFVLRPWRLEDATWYVQARDEEVFKWTTERRDLTLAEAEAGIQGMNDSADAVCMAIASTPSMEVQGNIALAFSDDTRKCAEIMYWLTPSARGKGLMTKAVNLMSSWAFGTLGLERITLKANLGNERSQRVAARAGFRRVEELNERRTDSDIVWFELRPGQSERRYRNV